MKSFMEKHVQSNKGSISIFDRMISKGYLLFGYPEAMEGFLARNDIFIKDFKTFAIEKSEVVKQLAILYARQHDRPYGTGGTVLYPYSPGIWNLRTCMDL